MLILFTFIACFCLPTGASPPLPPLPPPLEIAVADAPAAEPFCSELVGRVSACDPKMQWSLAEYGAPSMYSKYPEISRLNYVEACRSFAERRAVYAACPITADCREFTRCIEARINDVNFDPASSPELCPAFALRGGDAAVAAKCAQDEATRAAVGACMRTDKATFPACAAAVAAGTPTLPPATPWKPRPAPVPLPEGLVDVRTLAPDPVCEVFRERRHTSCKAEVRQATLIDPGPTHDPNQRTKLLVAMTMQDACEVFPAERDKLIPCTRAKGCTAFAACMLRVSRAEHFDPAEKPDLCEALIRAGGPSHLYAPCKSDPAVREKVGRCMGQDRYDLPWCLVAIQP